MKKTFILLAFTAFIVVSCKKDSTEITGLGTINLEFENVVNQQSLILGTQTYTNSIGQNFNVNTFKYYISNVEFTKVDGSVYKVPENYFLIDQSVPESLSKSIENIPAGDYNRISFIIGVDSLRNFAGAQTGDLAPEKGMFWTWNSGYIFVKMEGTSPLSTQTNNNLIFHIGGVSSTINTIKKASFTLDPQVLMVRKNTIPQVHFKTDVAKMFYGTQQISFAQNSKVMGGSVALVIANNYNLGMFSLDHIHN